MLYIVNVYASSPRFLPDTEVLDYVLASISPSLVFSEVFLKAFSSGNLLSLHQTVALVWKPEILPPCG